MTLKQLTIFLTLAHEGSFTKTASKLNCAQSGVTTHIKLLETELGVPLFNRIGKHISLTPEGNALLPYAKKILSLSSEAQNLYQKSPRLTIGVTESAANYLLGSILKEFTALCPDTEIFFQMTDHRDYCQMLCDGELDLAIVLDAPIKRKPIQVLQKRKEIILIAAASTHDLTGAHRIQPEDLSVYPLLLPAKDCPYRILFEQRLSADGIRPQTALTADSTPVIKEMALCGAGLGLLPEFAVKKELIYHMMEKINYSTDFPIYTQLLIHPDKSVSKELQQFLDVAGRHLAPT
ncbi:MAG: LysR family transcriptional regulator [Eubacterium sp.]|jgi:DNA-binding transcriptional LysR family regulator|nr:LysR family transcriptional regulator [Eubacterium sp.]NBI85909.1 LysR family transcriptional regulator [Lachnospiraceae bacterium]